MPVVSGWRSSFDVHGTFPGVAVNSDNPVAVPLPVLSGSGYVLWTAAEGVSLIAGELGSCSLSWVVLTTLMAGTVSSSLSLVEAGI